MRVVPFCVIKQAENTSCRFLREMQMEYSLEKNVSISSG